MPKKLKQRQHLVDQAAINAHETVNRLHEHGQKLEDEIRSAAGAIVSGSQSPAELELENLEGAVQMVVSYVRENPFAAMAIALGAGVMLGSMYLEQLPDTHTSK